jgi:hypothetical protein
MIVAPFLQDQDNLHREFMGRLDQFADASPVESLLERIKTIQRLLNFGRKFGGEFALLGGGAKTFQILGRRGNKDAWNFGTAGGFFRHGRELWNWNCERT